MNRKLDFPALLLFTALLFGAIVRFYPAITNGFPLNDGGIKSKWRVGEGNIRMVVICELRKCISI